MNAIDDKTDQSALDNAIADSFPASDPPSQTQQITATPTQPQIPLSEAGFLGNDLRVYRVVERRKASQPFSGPGAGGRWTSPGTPGVYASLSPAAAMLEYLVHLEGETPSEVLLAQATLPIGNALVQIDLPSDWHALPYLDAVRMVGDGWARARQSLALRVPSAVCPGECNALINPNHPDFAKLRLDQLTPLRLDSRLRT